MAEVTAPVLLDETGQDIVTKLEGMRAALAAEVTPATTATAGIVKPDGTTILVSNDGTISASASGPSFVQVTIAASGWSNNVYSFESTYPNASYDIWDITTNENTTDAQRKAWIAADCGGYRSTNTIYAHGTVPTIDIIVTLAVVSKS